MGWGKMSEKRYADMPVQIIDIVVLHDIILERAPKYHW